MSVIRLVVWACLCVTLAQDDPYCSARYKRLCQGKGPHVACKYPFRGAGVACENYTAIIFTNDLKQFIIHYINRRRQKIASGHERVRGGVHLPKPQVMMLVHWDRELAYLAQRLADQCNFVHDDCRATVRYPYAGQTVGEVRWRRSGKSLERGARRTIGRVFDAWWGERRRVDAKQLVTPFALTAKGAVWGHFSQLAVWTLRAMGCGAVHHGATTPRLLLVCDFSHTNMLGQRTISPGPLAPCPPHTMRSERPYRLLCAPPSSHNKQALQIHGEDDVEDENTDYEDDESDEEEVDTRRTTITQGFDDSYFTKSWATRPIRPLQDTILDTYNQAVKLQQRIMDTEQPVRQEQRTADIEHQPSRQEYKTMDTEYQSIRQQDKIIDADNQPVRLQQRIMDTDHQPIRQEHKTIDTDYPPARHEYRTINIDHHPVRQNQRTIDTEHQPFRYEHRTIDKENLPIRQEQRTIDIEHQPIRQEHRTIDTDEQFVRQRYTVHPDYQTKRHQHKTVAKDRRRPIQDARPLQERTRPIQDATPLQEYNRAIQDVRPTQDDRSIQEIPKQSVRQMLQDKDDTENQYTRPIQYDIDDADQSNAEGETVDADRAERQKVDSIDNDHHRPIRPTKFKAENKDPHLVIPIQDEIVDSNQPIRPLQDEEGEQNWGKTTKKDEIWVSVRYRDNPKGLFRQKLSDELNSSNRESDKRYKQPPRNREPDISNRQLETNLQKEYRNSEMRRKGQYKAYNGYSRKELERELRPFEIERPQWRGDEIKLQDTISVMPPKKYTVTAVVVYRPTSLFSIQTEQVFKQRWAQTRSRPRRPGANALPNYQTPNPRLKDLVKLPEKISLVLDKDDEEQLYHDTGFKLSTKTID